MGLFKNMFPDKKEKGYKFKTISQLLRESKERLIQGVYKGDTAAWHKFCMGTIVCLAGCGLVEIMLIDIIFEYQSFSHEQPIVNQSINRTLPPGRYALLNILQSTVSGEKRDNEIVLEVANKDGGAVVTVPLPNGMPFPDDWFGLDNYVLAVEDNGEWHFIETDVHRKQEAEYKQRQERLRSLEASESNSAAR